MKKLDWELYLRIGAVVTYLFIISLMYKALNNQNKHLEILGVYLQCEQDKKTSKLESSTDSSCFAIRQAVEQKNWNPVYKFAGRQ